MKKYAKNAEAIEKLSLHIHSILDDYFKQLQNTPSVDKKKLYEFVIEKVFEEGDPSAKRKKQIQASIDPREFRLHILGVSNLQDRYIIALTEKLLNQHCLNAGLKMEIKITYDSIFYTTHAIHNFRQLKYFREDENLEFKSLDEITNADLKKVYPDKYDLVKKEIGKERLLYADTFTPLNISSNLNIDKYICEMMEFKGSFANRLVKALDKNDDGKKIVNSLRKHLAQEQMILRDLTEDPYEPVMNKKLLAEKLSDDLRVVIYFYLLIKRNENLETINKAVEDYIEEIDYPFSFDS